MINGAKAPDLPNYPFNSQLKLTAINTPSFACQPLIRINKRILINRLFMRKTKSIKTLRYR